MKNNDLFASFDPHMEELLKNDKELKEMCEKEFSNELLALQIKEIRNKKRITQLELAKKASTTQSIIARIESWKQNISMKTLQKILSALWATIKLELHEN